MNGSDSQRGVRRPRSDSEDEDGQSVGPPQRRQRQSAVSSSNRSLQSTHDIRYPSESEQDRSHTFISSRRSLETPTDTPPSTRMPGDMGPPTNSYLSPSTSHAGPSSNSHGQHNGSAGSRTEGFQDLLDSVQRVKGGRLMYEEDRGWGDDAHLETPLVNDGEATPASISLKPGSKRMPIDREEVVRLILQGLRDAGYNQSADVLEAESGYSLSSTAATNFQNAILGGRWTEALGYLPELGFDTSAPFPPAPVKTDSSSMAPSINEGRTSNGGSRPTSTAEVPSQPLTPAEQARFLISQQKYLEQLELGQQKKALATLRSELTPITRERELLHTITSYMMCLDKDDLYDKAAWDGAAGSSRSKLLEQIQAHISPRIMVPQKRLATLLDQARRYQAQTCMYHQITDCPPSLYTDHSCRAGSFPTVTTHILADHTDEVWRIEWSPDGSMLASAGKDKQVVIWLLEPAAESDAGGKWSIRPLHHLREHRDPVDVISWSPDGSTLVTAADKGLYLWDSKTGAQKTTGMGASPHLDQVSAIHWLPDGSEFIVTSLDRKLVFYSPTGEILRQWALHTTQITDFVITPDATRIVALTTSLERVPVDSKLKQSMSVRPPEPGQPGAPVMSRIPGRYGEDLAFGYGTMEHGIMVIRLADKEIVDWSNDLHCDITGIKLSWDGKRVLISCNPDEIQMWQIEPSLRKIRSFRGHVQSRFLIRSCFGAVKDRFVLSGSEDGHVYAWQTNLNKAVEVLEGHTATVNSVAWNPVAQRRLFASCSDDNSVRIWQPADPDEGVEEVNDLRPETMEDEDVTISNNDANGGQRLEGMEI